MLAGTLQLVAAQSRTQTQTSVAIGGNAVVCLFARLNANRTEMTFVEHLVSVAEHTCEDVQLEPTSHYELSAGGILMKQTAKLCNYKTLPQVNTQVNELGGSHKLMHCNKLGNNSSCTAFVTVFT